MSRGLLTAVVLAAGVYALKSAGPLLLGGRQLPARVTRLTALLPAALLAALVAVGTVARDPFSVDAKVVGMVAAAVALWRRAPFVVVVLVAAAATAATRAVAGQ